jgi:lipopolysaccharide transport system ATP-binding protein
MTDIAIRVDNLSKRYRIGQREPYKALRDVLTNAMYAPIRRLRGSSQSAIPNMQSKEFIWALRNVSFEVKRGEVIGIIGRNGAGKTTLLKILSRITEPTVGYGEIKGRVGSLLEVGTGFHPELTGRENIYLNGTILGMKKAEIDKKFDEIVAFAEIEKFIDTPVKYYSSGMYVRLAFAVAAHLEPEILLVDEVLAVGDMAFQQKCFNKIRKVTELGRTVLLVSHNMSAIHSLCGSALWIDNGQIVKEGLANYVVKHYMESTQTKPADRFSCTVKRNQEMVKGSSFYFDRVEMQNMHGENTSVFKYNETLVLTVDLSGEPMTDRFIIEYYMYNELDQLVSVGSSGAYHGVFFNRNTKKIRIKIGPLVLTSGKYSISLSTCSEYSTMVRTDTWEKACSFTVISQPFRSGRDISSINEGVCILQQSFHGVE